MQEAEVPLGGIVQLAPVFACTPKQIGGSHNVGHDEVHRAVDRTVDMALGSKINDRIRTIFLHQVSHHYLVSNITMDEDMTVIMHDILESGQVASVSQQIEIDDTNILLREEHADEITADKAGATGHEECFHGTNERLNVITGAIIHLT